MKLNYVANMQLMPFLTAASCTGDDCIEAAVFPATAPSCVCDTAVGGINELYFIPCTAVMSEANVSSLTWWQGLQTANSIGRSGLGLGSIAKKGDTRARVASCRPEQITSITWALKFVQKCFDKTSARTHCAKMNVLISNFASFLCIARMCDGTDTILPIGVFTTSDFNWIVPETTDDTQQSELEISWKEIGFPCTIDVAGLSTVIPKLS